MDKRERSIKALDEIGIRARNIVAMREFYENVLGLELLQQYDDAIFFRIAPGYEGLNQSLVLFAESAGSDHKSRQYTGLDIGKTSLHHLAFAIDLSDYKTELDRLQALGLEVETQVHEWVHYRSLYVCDPDGNVVELVCYDECVRES